MQSARLPRLLFFFLVAAAAIHLWIYYPRLPDVVASHFAGNGKANGWASKQVFLAIELGAVVLTTAVAFGVSRLLRVLPVQLINLPNRDFWLAPERRAETLDFFEASFAWFGCALLVVLLTAMHLSFRANLYPDRGFDSITMQWTIGGLIAFALIWNIRLFAKFLRRPQLPPKMS